MSNVFDYLTWRGDLGLRQNPFNDVDSLILCRLAYIPFDGIVPAVDAGQMMTVAHASRAFLTEDGAKKVFNEDDVRLLRGLIESERFGRMHLSRYVSRIDVAQEEQFAAITISLGDGSTYVAFRGTDNTLVGWKEDFNMSFLTPVPSQRSAVNYLEAALAGVRGPVRVGGHSKGGNLAVYSSAFCTKEIQDKIVQIYNNDGPGFNDKVIDSPGYQAVRGRIHTFVPQSSVIGMLLEHEEAYTVVHSTQSGLMQHDMYSWEVLRDDFVRLETVTSSSRFIDKTLEQWVAAMRVDQREKLFDALYEIFSATEARTTDELTDNWLKSAGAILKSIRNIDEPTRGLIYQMLGLLFKTALKNV